MVGRVYDRVILKLSGESLAGDNSSGLNFNKALEVCNAVKSCTELGVQFGIVVGGGNFWRGRDSKNIDKSIADQIGMIATVMNALYLKEVFEEISLPAVVMSTLPVRGIVNEYNYKEALHLLNNRAVLIFSGGTGNTHFSTDSVASLRAAELKADVLLKATTVDGVYDSDPKLNKGAKRYFSLTYDEILKNDLKFMDSTATSMCKDNKIKVLVFSILDSSNIVKVITGENIGTFVS